MLLLGTAALNIPYTSTGGTVEIFSNGNSSLDLYFPTGGGEITVYVKLPVGSLVLNTTLTVKGDKTPNEKSLFHNTSSDFGTGQGDNVSIGFDNIQRDPMGCLFSAMTPYAAGDGPQYIAIGDLNSDGLDDVAVTNQYSNSTGVFYQAGGTLGSMTPIALPGSPAGIAIGDFNGDTRNDIAVAWSNVTSAGFISIFNQTTSGTIGSRDDLNAGNYPDGLAVGDINNDSRLDIAVANRFDGTVGVIPQRPGGGFYNMTGYVAGNGPRGVAIGDVNNDGLDDIVAVSFGDNKTVVLYQTGNGQIDQPATTLDAGFGPVGVAIGDVDSNGRPDIIVTNSKSNLTSVYYQKPDGTLIGRTDVPGMYSWPWGVASGDVNDDGRGDIVVANFFNGSDTVDVLVEDVTERPKEVANLQTGPGMSPDGVAIGDLNNDGLSDIAVANNKGDSIGIFSQLPYSGMFTSVKAPNTINITSARATWSQTLKGAPLKVELSNDDGGNWTTAVNGAETIFGTVGSIMKYRVNFTSATVLEDIRVNYTLEILYPKDLVLDVGLDGQTDWSHPGQLTGSEALPDLSSAMSAFVATHATEVDPEGNLSVPLRFTGSSAGVLTISGMSISYNMPPTIPDFTPKGTPINMNEGQAMNFMVNATDFENQTLNYAWKLDGADLGVNSKSYLYTPDYSSSGGHNLTVTVSDGFGNCTNNWELRVKNVNRAPVLSDFTPVDNFSLREGQSMMFHAIASDPDMDNLTVDWYFDMAKIKTEREGDATYGYIPAFGDFGEHNVTVMAYDGLVRVIHSWTFPVVAVNPMTDLGISFPVEGNLTMDENSARNFTVDLAPLKALLGNATSVKWSVDGNPTVTGGEYIYSPDYLSSGSHTVRASAFAGRLTYTRGWNVTVVEKDNPPSFISFTPGYDPPLKEGSKMQFSVVANDPDNDTLSYKWYINGTEVSTSATYNYEASWKSEGKYIVMVVVSDGRISINRSWQMTVIHAAKPAAAGGFDQTVILGILVTAVILAVLGGVMFFAYRKRDKLSEALDHFGGGQGQLTAAAPPFSPQAPPPPDVTPKPKPKATYPCPNCGGTVDEDWFLCHHCDAPLNLGVPAAARVASAHETMATEEALQRSQMKVEASECLRCGKMLEATAENCPTCGEYIKRPAAAAVMPASMATCPSCKSTVEDGWLKCPECGMELQGAGSRAQAANDRQQGAGSRQQGTTATTAEAGEAPPAGMPLPPAPPPAQPPVPAYPAAPVAPPATPPHAGTSGSPHEAAPVTAAAICPACGASVETAWVKCPECGTELK
jgi:hypothetical protein